MLIADIVTESLYVDELITGVSDLLSVLTAKGMRKVSTTQFQSVLAKQGFNTTMPELIQAVSQSGFASEVTKDTITLATSLPDDMLSAEEQPEVDVGQMADDQAMADVKGGL